MDIFSLKNKIIIVTGASGLLGREHVEAIANAGGIPILLDLNQHVIDEQVSILNKKFNIITHGYAVDITNESIIKNNCDEIVKFFGRIDGLVNNAANNPKVENSVEKNFSRLEFFSEDVWEKDLAVGLKGSFLCTK